MSDLKVKIIDQGAKSTKSISAFDYLADFETKDYLVAEVIRSELSSLRTSNAHTKTRGEVRGGGKKPWKQKGTGRARHGSIRSPIWIGGGITFGPRNTTNWDRKINKSARIAALRSLVKDRLVEEVLFQFADKIKFEKTKEALDLAQHIANNGDTKTKNIAIIYTTEDKPNLRGFANLDVTLINANNMKVHKLANAINYIFTPAALVVVEDKLKYPSRKKKIKQAI